MPVSLRSTFVTVKNRGAPGVIGQGVENVPLVCQVQLRTRVNYTFLDE